MLPSNVAHFYISKAFFKTCLYKLEYNFNDKKSVTNGQWRYWEASQLQRSEQTSRRRALWNIVQSFSRGVKRFAKENNIKVKTRAENGTVSVFIETKADVDIITSKYKTNLSAIWLPYNDAQVAMINDDLNATLVFRKSLFCSNNYNAGYRYKVQCNVTEEIKAGYETVNNFVSKLEAKDCKVNDNWIKIGRGGKLSYWNTFSMYFNDEQDIMMLKLMIGGTNFKVHKAVLYSELE